MMLRQYPPFPTPEKPLKVLFIGGLGRSGSTLLDRMLAQIPGFAGTGETVHLWRGLLEGELCGCEQAYIDCPFWQDVAAHAFGSWDAVDPAGVLMLQRQVDRNRYIPLMVGRRVAPGYQRNLLKFSEYVGRLYAGIQAVSGARVLVDSAKHSSYAFVLRRVPYIDLRLLHLVRDSRGVAYSWTKQMKKSSHAGAAPMQQYHPGRIGTRWLAYNLLFHGLASLDVPRLFVQYESLIDAPRETVSRIMDFAGEKAEGNDLDFIGDRTVHLHMTHTVDGNPMRFYTGALPLQRDDAWKQAMARRHQALVSLETWPLMAHYGYRTWGELGDDNHT
jgi:hypothetical protein